MVSHKELELKKLKELTDSINMDEEKSIAFITLLKAWKEISKEFSKEDAEYWGYEEFFNKGFSVNELKIVFQELGDKYIIFKQYFQLYGESLLINEDNLIDIYHFLESSFTHISLNSLFYKEKESLCFVEDIALLAIKLLGIDNKKPIDKTDKQPQLFNYMNYNQNPSIYIPFSVGFPYIKWLQKSIFIECSNLKSSFVANLIKIIENKEITFALNNPLINKPSFVLKDKKHKLKRFEYSISFPNSTAKIKSINDRDIFGRFVVSNDPTSNTEVAMFEHIISVTEKKAAILFNVGFSYRNNKVEAEFKKYLIDNNLLEAVIQLPANIYNVTQVEKTLFIINKNKSDDRVFFINLDNNEFKKKFKKLSKGDVKTFSKYGV